jgi:hypothetical protein
LAFGAPAAGPREDATVDVKVNGGVQVHVHVKVI